MKVLSPTLALLLFCAACGTDDEANDCCTEAGANDASVDGAASSPATVGDATSAPADAARNGDAGTMEAGGGHDASAGDVRLPPLNGGLDYQLGGAYTPDAKVTIVSRDRAAKPAAGLYNICYVNGFQTQPGEQQLWTGPNADLVLRDGSGKAVIDPNWPDEMLLDIRTPEKRARLVDIVGGWIDECASDGFDAVEIDNLDTYSRQSSLPAAQRSTQQDAVTFIRALADRAHARGLAIGQKNSAELVARRSEMATDFVVAEECQQFDECQDYKDGYGAHVLVIEYQRAAFDAACKAFPELSIVLRDRDVTPKGNAGYVYAGC